MNISTQYEIGDTIEYALGEAISQSGEVKHIVAAAEGVFYGVEPYLRHGQERPIQYVPESRVIGRPAFAGDPWDMV